MGLPRLVRLGGVKVNFYTKDLLPRLWACCPREAVQHMHVDGSWTGGVRAVRTGAAGIFCPAVAPFYGRVDWQ